MLASAGRLPREDDEWAFEIKWDGVRAIVYWRAPELRIESRNLNDISSRYPELRALGGELDGHEAVLDGEIVSFDERGTPSFERLQRRMHVGSQSTARQLARDQPVTFVIFDLLYLDGTVTMELPYRERRALLTRLDLNGRAWHTPPNHIGEGGDLLAASAEHGLEGIVAKRLDSIYRPGERVREWVKIKNTCRQELVIGGWLGGKGGRAERIGALLMGYYEQHGDDRVLRYAGRVGTGFDEEELERLGAELASRASSVSPFAKLGSQPPRSARFVRPSLVAEIEFSGWTREGILRHSSYKGLRFDKPAREVEMETEAKRITRHRAPDGRRARRHGQRAPARHEGRSGSGVYEVLRKTDSYTYIELQGRQLRLSNLDKVLYPRTGFTKKELIDYYVAVAHVLLPHLQGRPLTLKRYPNGVESPYFYEKRCPAHRPDWVKTAPIWSGRHKQQLDYCVVEDLPTLVWVANLASIELHTSLSLARNVETPTMIVFDLDPGEPAGMLECARVALTLRSMFDALELRCFVKGSGSKGLQVYVPLNTPVTYEQSKDFARAVAELLEARQPELVVSRMAKGLREGRVLIDWSQNDEHKTTVCAYSLRAGERPTISTPLAWDELEPLSRRRKGLGSDALSREPKALVRRLRAHGDLFAPTLTLRQKLPASFDLPRGGGAS